jgi:ABC-2 type transport system permease protein
VDFGILHPLAMVAALTLTSGLFAFLGFLLGVWANTWQRLHSVVTLIVTPLMFLGGTFYSIQSLPPLWRGVALLNPVVYLISGFRWSFYGIEDVSLLASTCVTLTLLAIGVGATWFVLRNGYGLRS